MLRQDSRWWKAGFTRKWWKTLSIEQREEVLDEFDDDELEDFFRDWRVWGRDEQLAPEGRWNTWLVLAGRGFGKTRTAVEAINDRVRRGEIERIAIVGQGDDDIREVMLEGDSGFLATASNDFRPVYQPSVGSGRLVWPNGAMGFTYSAMDPESLRGPQFDFAWFDEPMAVPADKRQTTVSNLRFGLRHGKHPRRIYTTTPKPHRWIREELVKANRDAHLPVEQRRYVVTRGSTHDNRENLPDTFFEDIIDDYEGTTLGRQEIYAEILGDEEGAIWTSDMLDACRVRDVPDAGEERLAWLQAFARECDRVVVGVDPNASANKKTSHAAGVIVAARKGRQRYILEDYSTKKGPSAWGQAAIKAFSDFDADEIVAEVNHGGDMVREVILGEARQMEVDVNVHKVRASRGKQRRAEPIASAYTRKEVTHLGNVGNTLRPGPFFRLESQMCSLHDALDPTGEDFDRCDAAVWALTRLGGKGKGLVAGRSNLGGFVTFGEFVGQTQ